MCTTSDIGRIILPIRANGACRHLSTRLLAEYHSCSDAQREEHKWQKNGMSPVGMQGSAREPNNFTVVLELDLVRFAISRRNHGSIPTGTTTWKNAVIRVTLTATQWARDFPELSTRHDRGFS